MAAIDLACAHRHGDYWESFEEADGLESDIMLPGRGNAPARYESDESDPLPQPEGLSGIPDQASLYNDEEREVGAPGSSIEMADPNDRTTIRSRSDAGTIRQEPFVSYQPEERYWTDYLRIALPIAGLLLLLAVFWYWASSFIGDDDNDPGQNTQVAVVETPLTAPTQTATVGAAVTIAVANTVAPTQAPTQEAAAPTGTTEAVDGGETGDGFVEGDHVVVNDNDVNLRADASTSSDIVTILMNGDELTILSGTPTEAEEYTWWNVSTTAGDEGWVVGDFIQTSGT